MSRETWTAESALQHSMHNYTVVDGASPSFGDAMRKALAIVRMHKELVSMLYQVTSELGTVSDIHGIQMVWLNRGIELVIRAKALEDET